MVNEKRLLGKLMKSVTALAAQRKHLLDDFNSRERDDEKVDLPQFEKMNAIEAMIARAEFKTTASKLAGLEILLENGDGPDFADHFKRDLFLRMQTSREDFYLAGRQLNRWRLFNFGERNCRQSLTITLPIADSLPKKVRWRWMMTTHKPL